MWTTRTYGKKLPSLKDHRQNDINCNNSSKLGHLSRDYRAPRGRTYGQIVQGQARSKAIIPEEVSFNVEEQQNMEGTLTLFHSRVRALFDTSASNSFIAV